MSKIKRALISLSNKTDILKILKLLRKYNVEIISSGGTYKEIKKQGFRCLEVSEFTEFPELLDGRVKTLHPKIHAGILNIRSKSKHQNQMKKNNLKNIDLIIVNFYPFEHVINLTNNHKSIIENIDIGGPTIVRAAAKNYNDVTVITEIAQYDSLIKEMIFRNGSTSLAFRERLSEEAFMNTSYYDAVIANYFNKKLDNSIPKKKIIFSKLNEKLRYGENPHQTGAFYSIKSDENFKQIHGKKLSYNNYNDILAALNLSKLLPKNTGTVIVKHANPCGVSINKDKIKSYLEALECDPVSAFGGIVSCNYKVNKKLAKELNKIFLEVIIANGFDVEALKILKKKQNIRIIDSSNIKFSFDNNLIIDSNFILSQSKDNKIFKKKDFKVVSKIKPSKKVMDDLIFAFQVCRNVKSNAIVLTKGTHTVGIGSGQPSRLDSCRIAINKMNKFQKIKKTDKVIAASDAFFPFVDGIETLVQAGVSAVIQPSGSIRDKEIIKFANQTDTILVFSKTRHFKH